MLFCLFHGYSLLVTVLGFLALFQNAACSSYGILFAIFPQAVLQHNKNAPKKYMLKIVKNIFFGAVLFKYAIIFTLFPNPYLCSDFSLCHISFFPRLPIAITFSFHLRNQMRAYCLKDKMYFLMVPYTKPYALLGNQKNPL